METSRMEFRPFWLGVAGSITASLILSAVSFIIEWWRKQPMTHALFIAACSFLIILGISLDVLGIYSLTLLMKRAFLAPRESGIVPTVTAPPEPKLTVRIHEGYCGERKSNPDLTLILLHVIVDGPPSTVKQWTLELTLAEASCFTTYQQMTDPVVFRPEGQDVSRDPLAAEQISDKVPHRGWLKFTCTLGKESRERHIFGATFTLTALDADGSQSSVKVRPGPWLHRTWVISN
jgi:hypothetical protein